MFDSYTRRKTPKIYPIGYPQINTPSSCCYLSIVYCEKRHGAMQKLFMKKKEKKKRDY
jgi:hypothetical protein